MGTVSMIWLGAGLLLLIEIALGGAGWALCKSRGRGTAGFFLGFVLGPLGSWLLRRCPESLDILACGYRQFARSATRSLLRVPRSAIAVLASSHEPANGFPTKPAQPKELRFELETAREAGQTTATSRPANVHADLARRVRPW